MGRRIFAVVAVALFASFAHAASHVDVDYDKSLYVSDLKYERDGKKDREAHLDFSRYSSKNVTVGGGAHAEAGKFEYKEESNTFSQSGETITLDKEEFKIRGKYFNASHDNAVAGEFDIGYVDDNFSIDLDKDDVSVDNDEFEIGFKARGFKLGNDGGHGEFVEAESRHFGVRDREISVSKSSETGEGLNLSYSSDSYKSANHTLDLFQEQVQMKREVEKTKYDSADIDDSDNYVELVRKKKTTHEFDVKKGPVTADIRHKVEVDSAKLELNDVEAIRKFVQGVPAPVLQSMILEILDERLEHYVPNRGH